MLTNAQLIREVRKPGRVYLPVTMANDVCKIAVEKADLLDYLAGFDPNEPAPWAVYGKNAFTGARELDVQ